MGNPTLNPTDSPTLNPTLNPTDSPTFNPTSSPTFNPTYNPTHSPTNSPTPYPSTTTPTVCADSTTFYFRNNPKRNCDWASNPRFSHVRCNKPNDVLGEVRAACPISCGGCPDAPTGSPVARPTDTSTSSPTMTFSPTPNCQDSSTFYLQTNTRRTCKWAERDIKRCTKPIDDTFDVQQNCPLACKICSAPTESPTEPN